MARVKTTWQKKERPRFPNIKLQHEKPKGLSDLTQWLETSKPAEILNDLRNYQVDWCPHIFTVIASMKVDDSIKKIVSCSSCGLVKIQRGAIGHA